MFKELLSEEWVKCIGLERLIRKELLLKSQQGVEMAKFFGEVGYGDSIETPPDSGVWEDLIEEFTYSGDVIRNARNLETGESYLDDIVVGNSISIVADQYAIEHFFKIKYVRWEGVLWTVKSVEVQRPRLILRLGSVYNGPAA